MRPEVQISGPRRCPRCRSTRAVPIEYGLPPIEMAPQADRGEFVLGGCCVSDGDPTWHCFACGADFGHYRLDDDELSEDVEEAPPAPSRPSVPASPPRSSSRPKRTLHGPRKGKSTP